MVARNDITGDELRSRALSDKGKENHVNIFGDKPVQKGSWVYDPELRKLVPKGTRTSEKRAPDVFVDNMEAYDSPISGEVIKNRKQRDRDLKANGCRPYEGFAVEKQEADRWQKYHDQKTLESCMDTAARTLYEIQHGYRKLN